MNNFDYLKNYQIPGDLLLELLSLYKTIGKSEMYSSIYKDDYLVNYNNSLEEDTFEIVKYLGLKVSFERQRLIITKDYTPKTKEENMVAAIKRMLISIRSNAIEFKRPINSIDILDMLKRIYGPIVKINSHDFTIQGAKNKSVRYKFNKILDDYDIAIEQKLYEPIILSSILIMEMYNIKPYSEYNELALILTYYYLLLKCGIVSFNYVSFFKMFFANKEEAFNLISKGSINYDQGTIFFYEFVKYTLSLINNSFKELKEIETKKVSKTAHKSDVIEESILHLLPDLFSKEDVARLNPSVSPSTIMRTLKKLHDMNYIIPLGTGRSAKWQKLYNPNKKEYVLGVTEDENTD
jgi:hypothetical protein